MQKQGVLSWGLSSAFSGNMSYADAWCNANMKALDFASGSELINLCKEAGMYFLKDAWG